MIFLKDCIEAATSVYPILGYHGELEVGLTICGVYKVKIEFPQVFFPRGDYLSEYEEIYIQRTIDLRELEKLPDLFTSIFNEYFRSFSLALEDNVITKFTSDLYPIE